MPHSVTTPVMTKFSVEPLHLAVCDTRCAMMTPKITSELYITTLNTDIRFILSCLAASMSVSPSRRPRQGLFRYALFLFRILSYAVHCKPHRLIFQSPSFSNDFS